MEKYHKIHTLFNRDPKTKYRTLLEGKFQLPEFEILQNIEWDFTEKVDGTNIRIIWNNNELTIAGKSDRAQLPPDLLKVLNARFQPRTSQFLEQFPDGETCFYGEGYGPRIQKGGGKYRDTPGFILFDIKIGGVWLDRENITSIANDFGISQVPLIGKGDLGDFVHLVKDGFSSHWEGVSPEGLVARPTIELLSRTGKRIITKLKWKDFRSGSFENGK